MILRRGHRERDGPPVLLCALALLKNAPAASSKVLPLSPFTQMTAEGYKASQRGRARVGPQASALPGHEAMSVLAPPRSGRGQTSAADIGAPAYLGCRAFMPTPTVVASPGTRARESSGRIPRAILRRGPHRRDSGGSALRRGQTGRYVKDLSGGDHTMEGPLDPLQ